jgi:hypothetical protein
VAADGRREASTTDSSGRPARRAGLGPRARSVNSTVVSASISITLCANAITAIAGAHVITHRRPWAMPPMTQSRNTITVQPFGDRPIAFAVEVIGEDPTHDICCFLIDCEYP